MEGSGRLSVRGKLLKGLPQLRDAVQALDGAVHVACVAQIPETCTKSDDIQLKSYTGSAVACEIGPFFSTICLQ